MVQSSKQQHGDSISLCEATRRIYEVYGANLTTFFQAVQKAQSRSDTSQQSFDFAKLRASIEYGHERTESRVHLQAGSGPCDFPAGND